MAHSLNKVSLIGNLGRDPEIRSTKEGKEIASLSIATSESWKDRATGEKNEKTEWHRVTVFNEGLVGVIKEHVFDAIAQRAQRRVRKPRGETRVEPVGLLEDAVDDIKQKQRNAPDRDEVRRDHFERKRGELLILLATFDFWTARGSHDTRCK